MPASITVTVSGQKLTDLKLTSRDLMREIGLLARERIIRRTLSGQQASGQPFAPYTPDYAKEKATALGSASPVNLQVSGAMLQGLTVNVISDSEVEVGY